MNISIFRFFIEFKNINSNYENEVIINGIKRYNQSQITKELPELNYKYYEMFNLNEVKGSKKDLNFDGFIFIEHSKNTLHSHLTKEKDINNLYLSIVKNAIETPTLSKAIDKGTGEIDIQLFSMEETTILLNQRLNELLNKNEKMFLKEHEIITNLKVVEIFESNNFNYELIQKQK